MTHQMLHSDDVDPCLDESRGKRMAQVMKPQMFFKFG
jgi:hypothetical protein